MLSSASDITPANVSSAVNSERTKRNIPTLSTSTSLQAAAEFKASDMITRKYFAHVDPDGHYIWDKIVADGYTPYTILGENLAVDFSDTQGLISAWIDSPTHRENMLNPNFEDQGMGVSTGDTGQGQYSIAIANTFGAQPVAAPVKTLQPPKSRPAQKTTTPTPKSKTTPPPAKPTSPQKTTPAQMQTQSPVPQTTTNSQTNLEIALDTVKVEPSITASNLNVHISFKASGATTASASVPGKSTDLLLSNNMFNGDLLLDKYFNLQQNDLTINVKDAKGNSNSISYSLYNTKLSPSENPKNLSNITQNVTNPDVYNIFRYIIFFFGIMFTILISIEQFFMRGKKMSELFNSGSGPSLFIIWLLLGTLALVHWWH